MTKDALFRDAPAMVTGGLHRRFFATQGLVASISLASRVRRDALWLNRLPCKVTR